MVHLECYGEVDANGKAALTLLGHDDKTVETCRARFDNLGDFGNHVSMLPKPVVNVVNVAGPGAPTVRIQRWGIEDHRCRYDDAKANEFHDSARSTVI